ncbi:MAG: superoxide dismutase [Lentimicrobium sp.]|nr:superoxide dismutase [Lentimicrobium sp.]
MKNKFSITLLVAAAVFCSTSVFAQAVKVKPVKSKSGSTEKVAPTPESESKASKGSAVKIPVVSSDEVTDAWSAPAIDLKFAPLPYGYDALEPVIDKLTVEIHYDRHHRAYYNNFIKAIGETKMASMPIGKIFSNIKEMPDAVRNNGGGYYNHVLYWENLSPKGGGEPTGMLAEMIKKQFGGFNEFVQKFNDAAKSRFGSGWAWLSVDNTTGELFISSTPNQDNPLMNSADRMGTPILALDVWEHAYYLKYQNKRTDYIDGFWKIVNWPVVEQRYSQIKIAK